MKINFYKYQGTGNDFIILDNRNAGYSQLSSYQIKKMCDRHFGIGADGLMLLENANNTDFRMVFYNSNGQESTMCGNGGRCIVALANRLKIGTETVVFTAIDGEHTAIIDDENVELKMKDVHGIEQIDDAFILNTGSPHFVKYFTEIKNIDVKKEGATIRYNDTFNEKGINVNFIQQLADKTLQVFTYERGVEDETLSCGTGVTAAALVHTRTNIGPNYVRIGTKGGTLLVKSFNEGNNNFKNIWLSGPANLVFEGEMKI